MIDNRMNTLIQLYKTKSFTQTSKDLNITQPAVSQHIRHIEDYYGVKVIRKRGKRIEFTREGELLVEYAGKIKSLSMSVENMIRNRSSIQRRYTVGATLTIGGYVLPKIIGDYKRENENIDIILEVENTKEVMKRLNEGKLDLALVEGIFPKDEVRFEKFKDDELVVVVSSEHELSKKDSVTMDQLRSQKLILRERGSGTREVFEKKLLREGYDIEELNVYMEIGDIKAILSLVESNLGISVVSIQALGEMTAESGIKILRIEEFDIMREFNFIYGNEFEVEFIEDFIGFCRKHDNALL